jgi:hypothetical protein
MLKRLLFLVAALFLASSVVFGSHLLTPAQAREPQNAELLYFIGEGVVDGVQLEWRTATEYFTVAFRIKRGDSASGPFNYIDVWQNGQQISIIPIQNPGFPETGGTYEVVDMDALSGQTYWYTLIEVEDNGAEIDLETIEVVAGLVQSPTPTGQVIGGGNTTSATATPTATQPAAASPTPLPTTHTSTSPSATTRANTNNATSTPPSVPTTPANTTTTGTNSGSNNSPANTAPTGGQPIAQITSTPATEAYPGTTGETTSLSPETPPETEGVYPEGQPTISPEGTETPYPFGETPIETTGEEGYQGDGSPVITDFGDSGEPGTSNNLPAPASSGSTATATANSTRGRIVLWVGFAAGLLIFAAGVFGTILLFTRKQNGPQ